MWATANVVFDVLGYFRENYTLLNYASLLARLGSGSLNVDFIRRHGTDVGVNHIVAGNPIRFLKGRVEIRPDMVWQEGMRWRDKALVTALTWPLLLKYGYLGRRTSTPREQG